MFRVSSFLKTMSPIQRSIVAFHFADRMGHEQVARMLNLNHVDYAREWSQARSSIVEYLATIHTRP